MRFAAKDEQIEKDENKQASGEVDPERSVGHEISLGGFAENGKEQNHARSVRGLSGRHGIVVCESELRG